MATSQTPAERRTVGGSQRGRSLATVSTAARWLRANRLPLRGTFRGALVSVLAIAAALALLHAVGVLRTDRHVIGRFVVVAGVVVLVIGPWVVRLASSLASERAARIREHERAELAAHLHDSVLQTLALIQQRAGDPRAVAGLARRQERELRRWLFNRSNGTTGDSAKAALERAAGEVEELHGVPIEAVIVGDCRLDVRLEALVGAAREAMTNAAKFAGSDHVDLYAELRESRSEVFVRDRGSGFDPTSIPEDRRGVRDSIVGRVERHGGRARVRSKPAQGTEVELVVEHART